MPRKDFLKNTITGVGLALSSMRMLTSPAKGVGFFRQLGIELPPGAFGGTLPNVSSRSNDLFLAVGELSAASADEAIAAAKAKVLAQVATTMDAMRQMLEQVQANAPGLPPVEELSATFRDFLLLDFLQRQQGDIYSIAQLLGLIDSVPSADPDVSVRNIRWEGIGQLISEPGRVFNDVYRWDTDFDAGIFLERLRELLRAMGLPGGFYPPRAGGALVPAAGIFGPLELRFPLFESGLTPETYRQFGITVSPIALAGGGKGMALLPFMTGTPNFEFAVCDRGEVTFETNAPDIRGVGIVVKPPFDAQGILDLTGSFHAAIGVRQAPAHKEEVVLLGTAGGTRLSLQGLGVRWFADGSREKLDLGVEATIDAVRLVIAPGEGDGFLQKALSGVQAEAKAAVGFGMSLNSGFQFRGGGQLALDIGTHLDVGPVHVQGLRLVLEPGAEGFGLASSAILKFDLGPMAAVAENIGIRATLRFKSGNLGLLDLDVGFLPPNGIGLSMDAGGFRGGGYLKLDAAKGEYAGALELDFRGMFSVKAIAIINTKMPDGSPGFSLLVVITAEFIPIQLSFGFTLNGVGGIFGLNRTVCVNALAEGIRTNSIRSVLFPQDIIANITRIISDIHQFFPAQEQHFVVGPMAKLGWGTPTIITAELGLLLDIPSPMFAIVGVLRCVLPAEEAPILRLQVNFIGVMDFDRGYIFFRADLYDSRLLLFNITGSMAFLVSWGDQQSFALSVGGFHPDFRDIPAIPALPDGLRNMARIGISLLSDDNPRLKVESYFAVTSNSVQFGAKVELYAGVASFNVYGFLGYDVLFQFDPLRFSARLYGGIAFRQGENVLAGINISVQLAGPTPWDARGTASIAILFFEIEVNFHVTWGDPSPAVANQTEDLLLMLQRELAETRNWRAELPPQNHLHVSLRTIDPPAPGEPLVIHPAGVLTFSQKSLPLDGYLIEKFGSRKPLADNKFTLSDANANGLAIPADFRGVREEFAPAHFSELSDADKLSRRSFEKLPSGFSLTGTSSLQAPPPVTCAVEYELSYFRRKPIETVFKGLVSLGMQAYRLLVRGSAVRQSALARQQVRPSLNAPPRPELPQEEFVLAGVEDLKPYVGVGEIPRRFVTQAEAYWYRQEILRRDPSLAQKVQVISNFELAS